MHLAITWFSSFVLLALTALLSIGQADEIPKDTFAFNLPGVKPREDISTINELVGDGDPRQVYFYTQLTHNDHCDGGDCEIAHGEAQTYEVGWNYDWGFSIGPIKKLLTFGFDFGKSFSKSATTELTSTCRADDGEHVCIWWRQAYTSLLVNVTVVPTPKWLKEDTRGLPSPWFLWFTGDIDYAKYPENPVRIRLPNANKLGSGNVCGRGDQCITTGATRWGKTSAPGGPQKYAFDEEFM